MHNYTLAFQKRNVNNFYFRTSMIYQQSKGKIIRETKVDKEFTNIMLVKIQELSS